jgi:hypothetical protein
MRIRRKDLDLLAEAYEEMTEPQSMDNSEDAEELHPLLKEMEDEIFLGIRFEDFMSKATKALKQRYLPSRGMGLDYFLDKVGKLMKVELEYQPEDGGYVIAVEDLRSEEDLGNEEDAEGESKLPRRKLRFQSQADKEGPSVLDKPAERTGPPQKKFRPLSQFLK